MPDSDTNAGNIGPATDRHNEPVIDPTENVKALNAAGFERQDKLREIEAKHVREILDMRSECAERVHTLEALLADEKFSAVRREQALTESHRLELKGDSEKAVTAAFAASKEAVSEQNKSATLSVDRAVAGMKELIINNAQVNQATTTALADKVEDLKASMAVIINTRIGAAEQQQESRQERTDVRGGAMSVQGYITLAVGIIAVIISAVAVIIGTR